MTECDKFKRFFSDYLDGEISFEERRSLEAHLQVCTDCSETMRQMKIIQESLRRMPQVKTSADFEQRLHQQIFAPQTSVQMGNQLFQNWKLPAMGSALVLATVGFFLIFGDSSDSDSRQILQSGGQFRPAATQISKPDYFQPLGKQVQSRSSEVSSTVISDSSAMPSDSIVGQTSGIHMIEQQVGSTQ